MKRNFRALGAVPLLAGALALAVAPGSGVAATTNGSGYLNTLHYVVSAEHAYCISGGTACQGPPPNVSNIEYARATAYGPPSGAASGAVRDVTLICSTGYIDKYGHLHTVGEEVSAGPEQDGGSISGSASAGYMPTESNTSDVSSMSIYYSYDPVSHDTGEASGTQTANNHTDTRVSGGFTITLNGPIYDTDTSTGQFRVVGSGTMSCSTNTTPINVQLPGQATSEHEGEVEYGG